MNQPAGIFCKTLCACIAVSLISTCASVPEKKYFLLNYVPPPFSSAYRSGPYTYTIRLKELSIEEAYDRPQIVYRQSPFELEYYYYRVWAVNPAQMVTDLMYKHLSEARLVSHVVRRFDEGYEPDYELSGTIEAIEEYDSDEVWFAHLAVRLQLVRLEDGRIIYTRSFDNRKRVFEHAPEYVVRELSTVLEYIMNQVLIDLDKKLSSESGIFGSQHGDGAGSPSPAVDVEEQEGSFRE